MRKRPNPNATMDTEQHHFDILVAPGYVLLELASLVEVLRLANRVCPHPPFTIHLSLFEGRADCQQQRRDRSDRARFNSAKGRLSVRDR